MGAILTSAALISSPLSNVGVRPYDASISTHGHVTSHHEPLPTSVTLNGNRITSFVGTDPNADVFAEIGGAGPTLVYDSIYQVFGAQYLGAQYLVNTGTWANRVAGGVNKPYSHHCLVRIDDLPTTTGSALMSACNSANNNSYLQQVITHPASGVDNYKVSRKGATGVNLTVSFTSPSRKQYLNLWTCYDGTNTSWYCEGVRIGTLAHANASSSPNRGVMGALFLSGIASTFATMTVLFDTWYDIGLSVAQMREVDDAFTKPRFCTRGNNTNGELILIDGGGYQQSTSHCATWRSPIWTINDVVYTITRTNQNSRDSVRTRPIASRSWDGSAGDTPPTANRDSGRDGHDNESMGVAGDGKIFYSFDMHGVPMQSGDSTTATIAANGILAAGFGNFLPYSLGPYASAAARTTDLTLNSGQIGQMCRQTSDDTSWILTNVIATVPVWQQTWGELAVTYPNYIQRNNGDLFFIVRDGRSGQGWQPCIGIYNATTGVRTHLPFIFDEGTGGDPYNFYVQIFYDAARDIIHISGVCRHGASAGVESNEGIYHMMSADGGVTWTSMAAPGVPLTLPVSNATAPKVVNVGFNHEIINQQTMCVDPATGFPVILMHYAPSMGGVVDMHCIYWDGSAWQNRTLGILNQPHSYGAPAGTAGNPGGALPATTGAVIGRAGSVGYNGKLFFWMVASQWGNGVYEFTLPFNNLSAATPTKTLIIADDAFKDLGAGFLIAAWEGQTPCLKTLADRGEFVFTFQRAAFESPTTTAQSVAWPAWPIWEYRRSATGTPIAPTRWQ